MTDMIFIEHISDKITSIISTGALGGVYRIDLHMFAYEYTSEQLTKHCQKVVAVSVVLSSADISKLDDNTLKVIVQETYADSAPEKMQNIYKQIKEARDSAQSVPDSIARAELHSAVTLMNLKSPLNFIGAEPLGEVKTISCQFHAMTPMNQGSQQASGLETWIRGRVAAVVSGKAVESSVWCFADDKSTSDSCISGVARINLPRAASGLNLADVVGQALEDACDNALSDLMISSYEIDPVQ